MKKLIYLTFLLAFICCNDAENSEQQESSTTSNIEQEEAKFEILSSSTLKMSNINYEGEMLSKKSWKDINGENLALFTKKEDLEKGDATIYAYHYVAKGEDISLLQKATKSVTDCVDSDLILKFEDRAVEMTDLNKDNIGEITFAYRSACITDLSPQDMTLHLFENGKDYTLIGDTEIQMSADETIGGNIKETRFDNAPSDFLSHANNIWENIKKR